MTTTTLRTFEITYWTGGTDTREAATLRDAYLAFGYVDGDGSHLWEPFGEITNQHGDLCATIKELPLVPAKGMPATIHLAGDTQAAVVVKVNKKSITVATVETGPMRTDTMRDGPYPVMVADGILDKIVGSPERYATITRPDGTVRYGAGSIRVTLGRSVSVTDYRL